MPRGQFEARDPSDVGSACLGSYNANLSLPQFSLVAYKYATQYIYSSGFDSVYRIKLGIDSPIIPSLSEHNLYEYHATERTSFRDDLATLTNYIDQGVSLSPKLALSLTRYIEHTNTKSLQRGNEDKPGCSEDSESSEENISDVVYITRHVMYEVIERISESLRTPESFVSYVQVQDHDTTSTHDQLLPHSESSPECSEGTRLTSVKHESASSLAELDNTVENSSHTSVSSSAASSALTKASVQNSGQESVADFFGDKYMNTYYDAIATESFVASAESFVSAMATTMSKRHGSPPSARAKCSATIDKELYSVSFDNSLNTVALKQDKTSHYYYRSSNPLSVFFQTFIRRFSHFQIDAKYCLYDFADFSESRSDSLICSLYPSARWMLNSSSDYCGGASPLALQTSVTKTRPADLVSGSTTSSSMYYAPYHALSPCLSTLSLEVTPSVFDRWVKLQIAISRLQPRENGFFGVYMDEILSRLFNKSRHGAASSMHHHAGAVFSGTGELIEHCTRSVVENLLTELDNGVCQLQLYVKSNPSFEELCAFIISHRSLSFLQSLNLVELDGDPIDDRDMALLGLSSSAPQGCADDADRESLPQSTLLTTMLRERNDLFTFTESFREFKRLVESSENFDTSRRLALRRHFAGMFAAETSGQSEDRKGTSEKGLSKSVHAVAMQERPVLADNHASSKHDSPQRNGDIDVSKPESARTDIASLACAAHASSCVLFIDSSSDEECLLGTTRMARRQLLSMSPTLSCMQHTYSLDAQNDLPSAPALPLRSLVSSEPGGSKPVIIDCMNVWTPDSSAELGEFVSVSTALPARGRHAEQASAETVKFVSSLINEHIVSGLDKIEGPASAGWGTEVVAAARTEGKADDPPDASAHPAFEGGSTFLDTLLAQILQFHKRFVQAGPMYVSETKPFCTSSFPRDICGMLELKGMSEPNSFFQTSTATDKQHYLSPLLAERLLTYQLMGEGTRFLLTKIEKSPYNSRLYSALARAAILQHSCLIVDSFISPATRDEVDLCIHCSSPRTVEASEPVSFTSFSLSDDRPLISSEGGSAEVRALAQDEYLFILRPACPCYFCNLAAIDDVFKSEALFYSTFYIARLPDSLAAAVAGRESSIDLIARTAPSTDEAQSRARSNTYYYRESDICEVLLVHSSNRRHNHEHAQESASCEDLSKQALLPAAPAVSRAYKELATAFPYWKNIVRTTEDCYGIMLLPLECLQMEFAEKPDAKSLLLEERLASVYPCRALYMARSAANTPDVLQTATDNTHSTQLARNLFALTRRFLKVKNIENVLQLRDKDFWLNYRFNAQTLALLHVLFLPACTRRPGHDTRLEHLSFMANLCNELSACIQENIEFYLRLRLVTSMKVLEGMSPSKQSCTDTGKTSRGPGSLSSRSTPGQQCNRVAMLRATASVCPVDNQPNKLGPHPDEPPSPIFIPGKYTVSPMLLRRSNLGWRKAVPQGSLAQMTPLEVASHLYDSDVLWGAYRKVTTAKPEGSFLWGKSLLPSSDVSMYTATLTVGNKARSKSRDSRVKLTLKPSSGRPQELISDALLDGIMHFYDDTVG